MERIGLIGVGNVGAGFARTLLEAGHPLTVHDRDRGRAEAAVALGAVAVESPRAVAAAAEVVLLSLPGSHAVEAVMEGPDGVLAALSGGAVVVDTGTSRPETAVHYERACQELGAAFIDAPITWRSAGWIVMVGGEPAPVERARPVLERLSYRLGHVGPAGRGQALKLMNQLVLAGQWATYGETIALMERTGLNARLLSEFLEFPVPDGLYGSDFAGGGTLGLHYKDLGYVLELAHEARAAAPMASAAHECFRGAAVAGEADWGQAGVVEYWRKLNTRPCATQAGEPEHGPEEEPQG